MITKERKLYDQFIELSALDTKSSIDLFELSQIDSERCAQLFRYLLSTEQNPILMLENKQSFLQSHEKKGNHLELIDVSVLDCLFEKVQQFLFNQMANQGTLYLQYLFIEGKVEDFSPVRGPLLMIPVQLIKSHSGIFLSRDQSRKIVLNSTLIHQVVQSKKMNFQVSDSLYDRITTHDFVAVKRLINALGIYFTAFSKQIEKFPPYDLVSLPSYKKNSFTIKNCLVLSFLTEVPQKSGIRSQIGDTSKNEIKIENEKMVINMSVNQSREQSHKEATITDHSNGLKQKEIEESHTNISTDTSQKYDRINCFTQCLCRDEVLAVSLDELVRDHLENRENVLIVCQNAQMKSWVIQKLHQYNSFIYHDTSVQTFKEQEKLGLNSATTLQKTDHSKDVFDNVEEYLNKTSRKKITSLLKRMDAQTLDAFVRLQRGRQKFLMLDDVMHVLENEPLAQVKADLSKLIKIILIAEEAFDFHYALSVMECVVLGTDFNALKKNEVADFEKMIESLSNQSRIRKYFARHEISQYVESSQVIEQELAILYEVFSDSFQCLTASSALVRGVKQNAMQSFGKCKRLSSMLMNYQLEFVEMTTYFDAFSVVSKCDDEMKSFFALFKRGAPEGTLETINKLKLSYLTSQNRTDNRPLQQSVDYFKQQQIKLLEDRRVKGVVEKLSTQVGGENQLFSSECFFIEYFPIIILSTEELQMALGTEENLFEVGIIHPTQQLTPQLYVKLTHMCKQISVYNFSSATEVKTVVKNNPLKVETQRIR